MAYNDIPINRIDPLRKVDHALHRTTSFTAPSASRGYVGCLHFQKANHGNT